MSDDEFSRESGRRRQLAVIAASAVSVAVLVIAAGVGVHSWRNTTVRSPNADRSVVATPLASAPESVVSSPPAVTASQPASAATVSPATSSSPLSTPSPRSSASGRPSSAAPPAGDESQLNFKVSMRLSRTHVMLGEQTRVTVTVLNGGHGIDPPALASIGSMVPGDDFSAAPSGCTLGNGGVECPIPALRAGRETTIAFTITTGYYPGESWDDEVYGQLEYADSFGEQQQLQPAYSADLMVVADTTSSPPTSAAPSAATPSSSPVGATTGGSDAGQ
jgi:hypothetical protein